MCEAFLDAQSESQADGANFRTEMVQSAAVLHAMVECGDRNGWFTAPSNASEYITPVTVMKELKPYDNTAVQDGSVPF